MTIRARPCRECPYRKESPSGLWSAEDYLKLPPYDRETGSQPPVPFICHTSPEAMCHGWAVVGMSRGHAFELLALRLAVAFGEDAEIPERVVDLFDSGTAAAEHGLRDIRRPGKKARAAMERMQRLIERRAESLDDKSSDALA